MFKENGSTSYKAVESNILPGLKWAGTLGVCCVSYTKSDIDCATT